MPYEFVMVLSSHRKLGELLLPYIIDRKPNQSYFQLVEILTPENINSYPISFSNSQLQLVKLTAEYSERSIHKLFCKGKNLKTFFDTVDNVTIETLIRPYCEKRIVKCLQILQKEQIKIYRKERKYQIVHTDEEVEVYKSNLLPAFNFWLKGNELKYSLNLSDGVSTIKLFGSPFTVLTDQPLSVLIDKTIYLIDDIDSKKILPFFSKDFIVVPEKNVRKYLSTFVRNTIAKYSVNADGFDIRLEDAQGQTFLFFEPDLSGSPAFRLVFKYGSAQFRYEIDIDPCQVILNENQEGFSFVKIPRNLDWENSQIAFLKAIGLRHSQGSFFRIGYLSADGVEQIYETLFWLNQFADQLKENRVEVIVSSTYERYYTGKIELETHVEEGIDWFDIKTVVILDGHAIPFIRLKRYILNNIREYPLPDGKIVVLPSSWFSRYRDLFIFSTGEKEHLRLRKCHAQVVKWCHPNANIAMADKLANIATQSVVPSDVLPQNLRAELRPYQKIGYFWMYQLQKNNLGGCLADDMGLGKTIQTIALLVKTKEEFFKKTMNLTQNNETSNTNNLPTSLIVMPVSLLHNWENEFLRFAPHLKLLKYFGSQRTRNIAELTEADVILTSYGIIRNEIEQLKHITFEYVILDESQVIKNPESKIYKAILQLNAHNRMVLTGTPIENSLTDLWAQLNFVNRNMLLSLPAFKEEFVQPIEKHKDEQKEEKLKQLIQPYILRRRKEDVLQDLPSLSEQIVYCDMTDEQLEFYEKEKSAVRNEIMQSIEQKGFQKSSIMILKALNRLRLISNHPLLVDPQYEGGSGKYDEITRSIENIISENHKVIVFSSYVKHINLVIQFLENNGYPYALLTGATTDRQEVVKRFQTDPHTKIFLISLKAGGTGLNLTAADYVFLLDPWWNPAAENQAISRAHRIGQDKKVFVYRFISSQSIEEKIITLQQKKQAIFNTFVNSANPFQMFDPSDMSELFS
ncbi:MAG: DEAD/DEAH box helicase [Bacteroidales bacterium]|nr:DEAD/DEAH box helicase [Bacteroidales bacterium]